MPFFQGSQFLMAPVFLLVAPDESPHRRRACIVVGRELRKIADDLEASFEAARNEKAKVKKSIVMDSVKTLCVVAGVVFVGRAVWKFMNT